MRTFAIGDIHGHYRELAKLLLLLQEQAHYTADQDHLVMLGDYVDSGPDSKEVVEWLIQYKLEYPDTFHPLKGNHDEMLVDALKYGGRKYNPVDSVGWWERTYGPPTLKSYGGSYTYPHVPEEHINFLDNLPLYYWPDDSDYFFVHAGIPPEPLSQLDPDDPKTQDAMLWIRGDFYNSSVDFGRKVIFGHTPFEDHTNMNPQEVYFIPYVKENMIGINTMPRNFGHLTAIELPEEKFWVVD